MLEHRQPLDSPPEADGIHATGESGLRIRPVEAGLLLLQSPSESAMQDAVTSEVALRLPAAGETSSSGDYALLWLTPAEWLLECGVIDAEALHGAFTRRLAGSLAAVTDMSDAFACCDLSGPKTCDILMGGCSLDLRTAIFPIGRVARTALAGIPAIIRRTGEPDGFRCLVDRSYARHFRDWLLMITR